MESYLIIGKATTLNGPGTAMLAVGLIAVMFLPRRLIVVAFVFMASFMTIGQQIVLASLSLSILRLMIAAAWIRIALRKEIELARLTSLDRALLFFVAAVTMLYFLRMRNFGALVSKLGQAYDAVGFFFLLRYSIRNYEDLRIAIRAMAAAMPLLMLLMSVETLTGRNPFALFGGVPDQPWLRQGRFRAQGPFRHPVLAGSFAATSVPLFATLWFSDGKRDRLLSVAGIISSTVIVGLTASSGPLMSLAAAVLSILLWRAHKKVKLLWYLFLVGLVILAANMKAPVWFLIARASDVFGGDGYHRAMVIDQTIRHFGEWWLAGTSNTALWMPYTLGINREMIDITNQFIGAAIDGGVLALSAFVLLVAVAFRTLVKAVGADTCGIKDGWLFWGLWGSLLSHVVTFFSVSYFDQMSMFWLLLLALISLVRMREFRSEGLFRPFRRNEGLPSRIIFE